MDADHARTLLARARQRVERALAELGPMESDGSLDPSEASDVARDLVEAEIDSGVARSLREELAAIERAERRLADGTYGRSVESGAPIPDARLEALPWAERTTEEQARLAPDRALPRAARPYPREVCRRPRPGLGLRARGAARCHRQR